MYIASLTRDWPNSSIFEPKFSIDLPPISTKDNMRLVALVIWSESKISNASNKYFTSSENECIHSPTNVITAPSISNPPTTKAFIIDWIPLTNFILAAIPWSIQPLLSISFITQIKARINAVIITSIPTALANVAHAGPTATLLAPIAAIAPIIILRAPTIIKTDIAIPTAPLGSISLEKLLIIHDNTNITARATKTGAKVFILKLLLILVTSVIDLAIV